MLHAHYNYTETFIESCHYLKMAKKCHRWNYKIGIQKKKTEKKIKDKRIRKRGNFLIDKYIEKGGE